ncbi:pyrimidine dimer DNA glycosylase/endonuclease V [Ornithinimicrobium cavernae]|uniref:pyrimidine dimer DNA glycosylase/endonuclease V n=1 Tax=Ornithinimicrobium cavernae TaxID=2666047 RepID=UPI000D686038|nr:pyrimidine dimer DNA glycosylase/endonuclease V [Ornithinimicrobium cavernae]
MRLWSLHPRYLDRAGLTAAWREALLAQAVLAGRTRGYTRHPQLERFRATTDPMGSIGHFLEGIRQEATERGYRFDGARIDRPAVGVPGPGFTEQVQVTGGQVAFEWTHLMTKLRHRSPVVAQRWESLEPPAVDVHPLFVVMPGPVAAWERP